MTEEFYKHEYTFLEGWWAGSCRRETLSYIFSLNRMLTKNEWSEDRMRINTLGLLIIKEENATYDLYAPFYMGRSLVKEIGMELEGQPDGPSADVDRIKRLEKLKTCIPIQELKEKGIKSFQDLGELLAKAHENDFFDTHIQSLTGMFEYLKSEFDQIEYNHNNKRKHLV